MSERLPPARRLLYGLGAPGYQITERIVVNIALYFYLPPAGRGLAAQVPERIFLGILTAFGAAMLVGRAVDSFADPFVGHASDRSRARIGRRRIFLLVGLLPLAALPVGLFWPPGAPGSPLNVAWLVGLLALYFLFFTVYVAPYLALIPELAWDHRERVRLATLLALLGFPVLGLYGSAWTWGYELGLRAGLAPPDALRALVVVSSLLALVLLAFPVLAVDERRFARGARADLPFGRALAETLRNRPFRLYLLAQMLFVLGVNMVQPALPYLAVAVLGRSEGFAGTLGLVTVVATFAGFGLVNPLAQRLGAKRAMVACVAVFALALLALGTLVPDAPGGPHDGRNLAIIVFSLALMGVPIAGFLILPQVMISQLIDLDELRTGAKRAAIYFGVQGLLTKWIYGAATALLAFLFARFGASPGDALGVRLVGPVAGVACLLATGLFAFYPERAVLAATAVGRARNGRRA